MNYKEFAKLKWERNNLFPKGTSGQEAMDILADYLMEYYDYPYFVTYPSPSTQVNTEVVECILYLLRKKTFWEKVKELL